MVLNKDQLIAAAARDVKTKEITPPGPHWQGGMRIRSMNAATKEMWVDAGLKIKEGVEEGNTVKGIVELQARLAVRSIIDETGARIFADEDWEILVQWDQEILSFISDEVKKLSNFGDENEGPSLESVRGELPSDQNDSSSSS